MIGTPVRQRMMPDGRRRCTRCLDRKTPECYHKDALTSTKKGSWCKECHAAASKHYRERYPERSRQTWQASALKHKAQRAFSARARKYGLTLEEWNRRLKEQEGLCAICKVLLEFNTGRGKGLAVDHDHETGKIRGFLCFGCNAVLGFSKNNPNVLREAIVYLAAVK